MATNTFFFIICETLTNLYISHLKFAAPSTLDDRDSNEKVCVPITTLGCDLIFHSLPHETSYVVSQVKPNGIRKRPSIRAQGLGKVTKQVY